MAYPYYQNNQFYMQDLQNMRDKIDRQMQQIQQTQNQQPVQPQIHQSFQLAPQTNTSEIQSKYVTDINEVKNIFVVNTGLFVNKDMNTLWLKNINGDIRTFELNEIIEKDPKDIEIEKLRKEIEDMKGAISNATQYDNTDIDEPVKKQVTKTVSTTKRTNAK